MSSVCLSDVSQAYPGIASLIDAHASISTLVAAFLAIEEAELRTLVMGQVIVRAHFEGRPEELARLAFVSAELNNRPLGEDIIAEMLASSAPRNEMVA